MTKFISLNAAFLDPNSIPLGRAISSEPPAIQENIGCIEKLTKDSVHSVDIKQIKEIVRNAHWRMEDPLRATLWQKLGYTIENDNYEDLYFDLSKELFGDTYYISSLPSFVDPAYCIRYYLTADGRSVVEKMLQIIQQSKPDITYCPILYPLISLLLHYMAEEKVFSLISNMLSLKQNYISQTKSDHLASSYLVMKLCKKYAKTAFTQLEKELKECEDLESMFQNWVSWIFKGLPFTYLIRVVDCFILEGKKCLYRIVIALMILYGKHTDKVTSEDLGSLQKLLDFFQNIPVPIEKVMKIAYSLRGFSDKFVNQQLLKVQMTLKSHTNLCERSASADRIPQSNSAYHLQVTSDQPIIKELKMESISRTRSVGVVALGNFKSSIVTPEQMSTIWSWLPLRISMLQPEVIYSSNEHGVCLTAFYMTVGKWEPTILVVKAVNDEVFGAYCSSSWNARNESDCNNKKYTYFGTGETFLFTITPEVCKFPWVGCTNSGEEIPHSAKLFMAADNTMINVGAGNGQGLLLDDQLLHGRTEHCDTFDNPPLCSKTDFQTKIVEVIAFK